MSLDLAPVHAPTVGFVDDLARWGARPALVAGGAEVSYDALAARVAERAATWSTTPRRLVVLAIAPTLDSVTTYLAALAAGHAVVLASPERAEAIGAAWDGDGHALHPGLALLLSTSGTTGSPRLVRLSRDAVTANAVDIAAALGLTDADRGVTTLPLHYCYGLSVLHSHLAVGASVFLTDRSVVDPELWADLRTHGVTDLAGVPHTYDLLESSAAPTASVPSLRLLTQAGGRMAPEAVQRWAGRGAAEGWDLRVMYGQTEATARMAVTRPGQSLADPTTVGHPVGSSHFVVRRDGRPVAPGEVGELHFTGPGVMDGYAETPADLARGRDVDELATGDLGRLHADGSVEVVGRRSDVLKVAGLRIDVAHVEESLARDGVAAVVGGDDDGLHVLVECSTVTSEEVARDLVVAATGLTRQRVGVVLTDALPRLPHGKVDRVGAQNAYETGVLARLEPDVPSVSDSAPGSAAALVALYADLLDRPDATPESSFVSLGGDSLSYVELAVRLEEEVGTLPADWPRRPVAELAVPATATRVRRTAFARIDTTIVLRALAIVAIVGSHTHLYRFLGGAHILLGVAGWNFARFAADAPSVRVLWQRVGRTTARIAVPVVVWVAAVGALFGTYGLPNVGLVNWLLGPDHWTSAWRLWFVEALVWILVLVAGLLSVGPVRRLYARAPFPTVLALAAVASLSRLDSFDLTTPPGRGTVPAVLWLFALGWAAHLARGPRDRVLVSLLVVAALPGFMHNPAREATIAAGLLLLTWVPTIPVPRLVVPVLSALASASLFIYLTHFEIYRATPWPLANFALGLALGLLAHALASRLEPRVRRLARAARPALTPTTSKETRR